MNSSVRPWPNNRMDIAISNSIAVSTTLNSWTQCLKWLTYVLSSKSWLVCAVEVNLIVWNCRHKCESQVWAIQIIRNRLSWPWTPLFKLLLFMRPVKDCWICGTTSSYIMSPSFPFYCAQTSCTWVDSLPLFLTPYTSTTTINTFLSTCLISCVLHCIDWVVLNPSYCPSWELWSLLCGKWC